MLTDDALTSEDAIVPFVGFAELAASGFLDGRATLGMPFLQPLIAAIAQALNRWSYVDLAAREELKVVLAPFADGGTENLPTGLPD
jgi:hypothetical protein